MTEKTRVVIIGTGFGGLGLGTLLRRNGIEDFVLVERSDDVGGTWRDNRYPGAACDVPSHLYSFSFHPKPDWSRVFAPATEIWEYLRDVAREEGLLPKIRFNADLMSATWDAEAKEWVTVTTAGEFRSSVLVTAMGHLSDAKWPDIPGLKDFAGELMHSAQWNHDYDVTGKRVAVIGSGASAIQITPSVAEVAKELVVFQRSQPYVIPRPDRAYSDAEQRMFARNPELIDELRADLFWGMEYNYAARRGIQRCIDEASELATKHRETQVTDPVLRDLLTPDYDIGCKRVLISNVYYPALQKPSVTLEAAGVSNVRGNTVTSTDGNSYEVDVIICATGFEAIEPPFGPLIEAGGRTLADHWSEGMQAYASITVPAFPNLFVMNGPNTGLGHNSVLFVVETQCDYIIQALHYMESMGVAVLDTKQSSEDGYIDRVRARSKGTVWLDGGCTNWYVDPRTHRLTVTWPDYAYAFRETNGRFEPEVYQVA